MTTDLAQEFKLGGTGFATGTICRETSLYKCTDNNIQFIQHIGAGDTFPPFPGGKGTSKTYWYKVTKTTDGGKTSFDAVVSSAA